MNNFFYYVGVFTVCLVVALVAWILIAPVIEIMREKLRAYQSETFLYNAGFKNDDELDSWVKTSKKSQKDHMEWARRSIRWHHSWIKVKNSKLKEAIKSY